MAQIARFKPPTNLDGSIQTTHSTIDIINRGPDNLYAESLTTEDEENPGPAIDRRRRIKPGQTLSMVVTPYRYIMVSAGGVGND